MRAAPNQVRSTHYMASRILHTLSLENRSIRSMAMSATSQESSRLWL